MRKKWAGSLIAGMSVLLMLSTSALAAGEAGVAGTFTGEEDISLYVKGLGIETAGEITAAECQIGTKTGQTVELEDVSDMENLPRTLIMVDNSLSITEGNREKISAFLTEYVYSTGGKEEIALAVFDEELRTVVDHTTDHKALRDAVKELSYQDQETYLTDVLYDVIDKELMGTQDCYRRIVIISDGVDNKAIGYTKEELYDLIKEKGYPIYTLGCVYKENNEQLENMFALSRLTGGLDYVLDNEEDMDAVVDAITRDGRAVCFHIRPDAAEMDGGIKNILLTLRTGQGEMKIESEVKMPMKAESAPAAEEESPVPAPASTPEELQPAPQPKETGMNPVFPVAAGGVMIILLAAAAVIFLRKRSGKDKGDNFVVLSEPVKDTPKKDTDKTVLVSAQEDGDRTQMIWAGDAKQYTLHLTDIKNPGRTFQIPLKNTAIIGRRAGEANLVIDYEKSISSRHCQITERGGRFYVKDLQSSNGTMLNGTRILSEMEIYSGSILTLGRLELKVEIR